MSWPSHVQGLCRFALIVLCQLLTFFRPLTSGAATSRTLMTSRGALRVSEEGCPPLCTQMFSICPPPLPSYIFLCLKMSALISQLVKNGVQRFCFSQPKWENVLSWVRLCVSCKDITISYMEWYSPNLNQVGLPQSTAESFTRERNIYINMSQSRAWLPSHIFHFNSGSTRDPLVFGEPRSKLKASVCFTQGACWMVRQRLRPFRPQTFPTSEAAADYCG